MPRPRTLAIGALALLLAAAPFIPRGGGDDGSLKPTGKQEAALVPSSVAGPSRLTAGARAEIERVVAAGATRGRLSTSAAKSTPETLASALVRCADFEGQRYCLHSGWTEASTTEVQARVATAARQISARPVSTARNTGDLDTLATLRRAAAMSPSARAAAERRELTMAARAVAKIWLL